MKKIEMNIYPGKEVKQQGNLFGIFFEDLNHAADGGLYAELIRNRSFEFDAIDNPQYNHMTGWEAIQRGKTVSQTHIESLKPLNHSNQHFARIEVMTKGAGGGIRNIGFGAGIPIEKDASYWFSCYYRVLSGKSTPIVTQLENKDGTKNYAKHKWTATEEEWCKYECEIKASAADFEGRLSLLVQEPAVIDFDMISLFPKETFRNRRNGLRKDLAEMLSDMKPSFMRFPGGCLVHIGSLNPEDRNSIYRWKNTLGPIEERPARKNNWNYNQTLGLGYFEYFQFCEDIGAEPMPVIAAGYDPHFLRMTHLNEMQEWIDEALDLIEFANGEVTTTWGALRATLGHPESFNLKYLGIGNEEVGDGFFERYEIILSAVKEKYPEIKVIGSAGPGSKGSEFDKGWKQAGKTSTDFVDEHFYQCPEWYIANAERYKEYPAKSAKAFLGEYASHDNKWFNALAEAVFMIGMEKAPGLGLACYAPLLCNVDYINWDTNMLFYDNHRVYGTPNYYIQKLFMNNQGNQLIETSDNIIRRKMTPPILTGRLAMCTENAQVRIKDMMIKDLDTGSVEMISEFRLSSKNRFHECMKIDSKNYTVAFTFIKQNAELAKDLEGQLSFALEFASQDQDNQMKWVIDGWQRLALLQGVCKGKTCDMGMHLLETESDKEYHCLLKVEGGKVTTYIDEVKYCEHSCQIMEPESLYYSAVQDEENIMIKAANVEEEEKELLINIADCETHEATLLCIENIDLEARNSFENPTEVSPMRKVVPIVNSKIQYVMPGYSFGIFIVERKEK